MPQGQLVKITAARKLMVKIDTETFDKLSGRLLTALKQNKFKFDTEHLATKELENDDGEMNQFVFISLDKYDKQLLERKFEPLLKKPIIFQCRTNKYDFVGEDVTGAKKQVQGVNLELTSICLNKKKEALYQEEKKQKEQVAKQAEDDSEDSHVNDPVLQLVAQLELQEAAGTLPPAPKKKLTPIELAMKNMDEENDGFSDGDSDMNYIVKQMNDQFGTLPPPPELIRQTGQSQRRRRTNVQQ